jgi:hypothetical protein
MRYKLAAAVLTAVALLLSIVSVSGGRGAAEAAAKPKPSPSPSPSPSPTDTTWNLDSYGPRAGDDVVLQWNEQILETIRRNPAATGPTVTARMLGEVHTSMYDAWAAYDPVARRTQPTPVPRQPGADATVANKSKAISYAAYTTLVDLFPSRTAVYAQRMSDLGYPVTDPDDGDGSTPAWVGIQAARANLAFRHADGSHQTLDDKGTADPSDDVVSYPCPGCYTAVNTWDHVADPWHWQPLCVITATGVAAGYPTTPAGGCDAPYYTVQAPLTPQWGGVTPFALNQAIMADVPGPTKNADGTYSTTDIEQALADTSNLDDAAKAKAEYWADGPQSVFPPGHMMIFAQALSRRRGFSLDTDVKLFFALGNAVLDAGIGAWELKYRYDFVRPITAIREHYAGQQITSWLGPNKGFGQVPAEQWMPYQALTVVTPPFPEYVSGHSTFSGAGEQVLQAFTGSDAFNAQVVIPAGTSKFESNTPSAPVTLTWPTYTAASDEAGMSRRWGGIHFYSGDYHGRMLGKSVGSNAWSRAQSYLQGYTGY